MTKITGIFLPILVDFHFKYLLCNLEYPYVRMIVLLVGGQFFIIDMKSKLVFLNYQFMFSIIYVADLL